jgi:hypothetical protein
MNKSIGKLKVWHIKDVCECIDFMINDKFDCNLILEGNRGLGKSTLAWKICRRLSIPFKPWEDLVYSREDTLKGLATKLKRIIFADELINVAYNRDLYESQQKDLLKTINMYRDSCNVFIGCVPKFVDLDVQLQKLCKIRLTVIRRGVALVQTQVPSIYKNDPWDVKNNTKIETKWLERGAVKPHYGRLTTVRGILIFGDLPPKQRALYEKIKKIKRNRIYNEYTLDDPENTFYNNLIDRLTKGNLTPQIFNEVCLISNKKYRSVQTRINQILKERGETKTFKDFISLNNSQAKNQDRLGFSKDLIV